MTRDIMDLKNIGIDSVYWKVWWDALHEDYDPKVLLDSLSPNQLECKQWLIDNLPLDELHKFKDLKIHLYGGWFGWPLIDGLMENLNNIHSITNIDIDEKAINLCRKFTYHKLLNDVVDYKIQDVMDPIDNDEGVRLVINTSSEHMPPLPEIIKNKNYAKNCVFILQSNNMFHIADQHINCCNSVHELIEKSQLKKIWFFDTLKMSNGYERYMLIRNHNG